MANRVDSASDIGQHCLFRPVCSNTLVLSRLFVRALVVGKCQTQLFFHVLVGRERKTILKMPVTILISLPKDL